jgi:hypothetical protein
MILAVMATVLYVFNRLIIIPGFSNSTFFHEYFGDLLALPAYLPASLFIGIKLNIVARPFEFRFYHIVAAVLIFSAIFEGLLPIIDSASVRDPYDILAYFVGGVLVLIVSAASGTTPTNKTAGEQPDAADSSMTD